MIRRTSLFLVEIAAGLVAGLVILAAIAVWRLASGPIALNLLTPYLERALSADDGSLDVEIASTNLLWAGWERALDIRIADVRVKSDNGDVLMTLPQVALGVSLNALVRGKVAPTSLEIIGAKATFERSAEGRLAFGLAAREADSGRNDVLSRLVRGLLLPSDPNRPLGYLKRVSILSAELIIQDQRHDILWEVPKADIVLTRGRRGLTTNGLLTADFEGQTVKVATELVFDPETQVTTATLTFHGLQPAFFAAGLPVYDRILRQDLLLSGALDLRIEPNDRIESIAFELDGSGHLDLPELFPHELKIAALRLRGAIDGDLAGMRIEDGFVDLGGPRLWLRASANRRDDAVRIEMNAALADLQVDSLADYWPVSIGDAARDWVIQNVTAGTIRNGGMHIVLDVPIADPAAAAVETLSGTLAYSGISVDYFSPLPKATGIDGTGSFGADRFDLLVDGGRLRDIMVEQATINMTDLDTDHEKIVIAIDMRGPLRTALEVLDQPPLQYARGLGLDVTGVGGDAEMHVGLHFPLTRNLDMKQVSVATEAELHDVSVASGLLDFGVAAGDLKLTLDNSAMHVVGRARINDIPAEINWQQRFEENPPFRTRIVAKGRVDDADRAKLGMPEVSFVAGPAAVVVDYTALADGHARVAIDADLTETTLSMPRFAWRKPPGQPGKAKAELSLDRTGHPLVDRFSVQAGSLKGTGRIVFERTLPKLWHAEIQSFEFDNNQFGGVIASTADGGYDIDISGRRFDIGPLIDGPSTTEATPPLRVRARFDELLWGSDRRFTNVTAMARHDGTSWQALAVEGEVGGGATLKIDYGPAPQGFNLKITSDDAGRTLRTLNWTDKLRDGSLVIAGTRIVADQPLTGDFTISNYNVIKAPTLARLLQVASLTGIFQALGQSGLDFDILEGRFSYRDGLLELIKTRTYGSSLGITIEGTVDLHRDIADLRGTLVPAYTVNRVLGNIPVVGQLLTGGENEGVFAATYAVKGRLEDPEVTVNPLSALAPGFLRSLFSAIGRAGEAAGESAPSPAQ